MILGMALFEEKLGFRAIAGMGVAPVEFCTMKSSNGIAGAGRPRKRSYTVRSVIRAAAILKAFSSSHEVLTLRAVAENTKLDKGTSFACLKLLWRPGSSTAPASKGISPVCSPFSHEDSGLDMPPRVTCFHLPELSPIA